MKSNIVTAMLFNSRVRVSVMNTTEVVKEAQKIHGTCHTATAALGRAITAGVMLGDSLKEKDYKCSLILNGGGPVGRIIVDSNNAVHVRADIDHPVVNLPLRADGKLDVGGAVGVNGYLRIIKDIGLKEPYIGTVDLVSGEIGEDLTSYFFYSEQIPSAVAVGVLVNPQNEVLASGGFLAQLLPDHKEEHIEFLEGIIGTFGKGISHMLFDTPDTEELLSRLLKDAEYHINSKKEIEYRCNCSRQKLTAAIISMGRQEIASLIEEGGAELTCHFCNSKYYFSKEDLEQILQDAIGRGNPDGKEE